MDSKRFTLLQALKGDFIIMSEEGIRPNFSELARLYGMDRHTIAKYWKEGDIAYKHVRGSPLDGYAEIIVSKLEETVCTKTAMYRWLKRTYPEFPGTYSAFAHYTKRKGIDFRKSGNTSVSHVRFETDPGQQLQVDWKEDIKFVYKTGEILVFNLYSATFGFSRKHFFIFSIGKGTYDFIRCTLEVLMKCSGKPKEILTDNMSAITNHHTGKLLPEISQFSKDIGVKIRRAKIKTPQTKGKDESANRFIQWLAPYQNELEGLQDLLREIDDIEKDCNAKPNETTKIPPNKLFKKEMEYLSPIPNKALMDSYIQGIITQKVPQTQLIKYDGAQYSVPKKYIGRNVRIVPEADTLYIYDSTRLIAVHRKARTNTINYSSDDYMEGLRSSISGCLEEDDIRKMAIENLKRLERIGDDTDE